MNLIYLLIIISHISIIKALKLSPNVTFGLKTAASLGIYPLAKMISVNHRCAMHIEPETCNTSPGCKWNRKKCSAQGGWKKYKEDMKSLCFVIENERDLCGTGNYVACEWNQGLNKCVLNNALLFKYANKNLYIPKVQTHETHILREIDVDAMYHTFVKMDKWLRKYDVSSYRLDGGSLLAQKRNSPPGPFQWDDDLDITVNKNKDLHKLRKMVADKQFKKELACFTWGAIWQCIDRKYYLKTTKTYVFDIFFIEKIHGHDKYEYHYSGWPRKEYPKCGIRHAGDMETETCMFWGIQTFCPKGWKIMNEDCYGSNWSEVAYKWNHKTSNNEKVDLTLFENIRDRLPLLTREQLKNLKYPKEIE